MSKAVILGCGGLTLTLQEKSFFQREDPLGFILFARNLDTPAQVRSLVHELRSCVSHPNCPILIDQEGGRVSRLPRTFWPVFPPLECYGTLYKKDQALARRAVHLAHRLIAHQLYKLGITVNCAPMLDIITSQTDWIIGERAFGDNPRMIAELGQIASDALFEGGVIPITKHIPGHGRALADSHYSLPTVDTDKQTLCKTDFYPFSQVKAPLSMVAHILYPDLDPHLVATHSPTIIKQVIRKEIGYKGILITDDLSMGALGGTYGERTTKSFEAGIDLALHCNGNLDQMSQIAEVCPYLSPELTRTFKELSSLKPQDSFDSLYAETSLLNLVKNLA